MHRGLQALLLGGAIAAAAGCAAPPPKPSPLAKKPFVPVNLYVNSDLQLSSRESAMTEYLATRFADSGAFLRVDRGMQRWAYSLQVRYRIQPGWAAADVGLRALSLLTLGLLPVRVTQVHALDVEVFLEPDPVARLDYRENARDSFSLYALLDPAADERAAADRLFDRLTAELARRNILPAAQDPPRQRKPKGRSQSL